MGSLLSTGFSIVAGILLHTSVDTSEPLSRPVVQEDRRVLVTGGTGFIGSHLVAALAEQGCIPRVLVRATSNITSLSARGVECIIGGLDDPAALERAVSGVDTVIHLAAVTRARSEKEYFQVNAEGTQHLVEVLRSAQPRPRRLIYVSSLAAAGPSLDGVPVDVHDVPRPITSYGRSKLAGEAVCLTIADEMEVLILRPPAVYGPGDRDLFRCFQMATRGILPVPTGPVRWIQFIHVHDLINALLCAVTAGQASGVYHVAEPQPYAWGQITDWLAKAVGRQVRAVRVPQWGIRAAAAVSELGAAMIGRATIFNREKAEELLAPGWLCETEAVKRDLGFEVRIPLPQGLVGTASWYREHGWL
ncbi:MAG: NAD-dependent epimerase/dehydratase family protein [Deltaproteobacteria bacterium]|nr:NAD-dependent epimerase/dehydratase family protein [Deltaproteobacteria bacterium]